MAGQRWTWRSAATYLAAVLVGLALLPFAIPLTATVYAVVWLYTWTHDPRARTGLLRVLPLHPRRVFRCSRALWLGMLDGLGGPTAAIIASYLVAKLSRSSRPQDTAVRDIKYGPQAKHRLDLFVPLATQRKTEARVAVVVIFPGYRWCKTKRARVYRPMAQTLCSDGIFVVLPRVGGAEASLEDTLCDFHQAVQWVFDNADNFGGDPKRVHLLGYGAGAHLCAMYSLVVPLRTWYTQADRISPDAQLLGSRAADQCLRRWVRRIKHVQRPVAGLVLVSGVFDIASQRRYETERCIENLSATSRAFGSQRELEEAWSPTAIVRQLRRRSSYIPPELFAASVLLIHGKCDSTFVLQQSQRLFRELCEIDVPEVNMKIYANLRRVDPSIALLAPASALAQSLLEDIRSCVSPAAARALDPSPARPRDTPKRGGASSDSRDGKGGGGNDGDDDAAPVVATAARSDAPTGAGAGAEAGADVPPTAAAMPEKSHRLSSAPSPHASISTSTSTSTSQQGGPPGLFAPRRSKSLLAGSA